MGGPGRGPERVGLWCTCGLAKDLGHSCARIRRVDLKRRGMESSKPGSVSAVRISQPPRLQEKEVRSRGVCWELLQQGAVRMERGWWAQGDQEIDRE